MPKPYTFPSLYDECKTLTISKLKEWGYMEPETIRTGTVHWSRGNERYASISIQVNMFATHPYLELNYKCDEMPIKYRVNLVSISSNINRAKIWYFLCPNTHKRCRKLYMVNTYFLHREAFKGAMYEKQTYSKNTRQQFALWGRLFDSEKIYEEIYSKYFKTHYSGRPTRRYTNLCKRLQKAENISEADLVEFFK